ncbi:hypothetical protein [Roseateles saccharophilus]|uniref:hypothetical protein n=1 Tax=Roseateles saccharophilus TaxID=304 RepID=UPI00286C50AB|nr:hypothetical protein [Roseateles saccharophilus]
MQAELDQQFAKDLEDEFEQQFEQDFQGTPPRACEARSLAQSAVAGELPTSCAG